MPLDLVSRVLESHGALIEREGPGAVQAVLPEELAAGLNLSEDPLLTADGRAGSVPCGHGTAVLDAAIRLATAGGVLGVARCTLTPPRPGPPQGYSGLNVSLRPGAPTPGETWTLTAHWRVDAVTDDRRLLHVVSAVSLEDACPMTPLDWSGVTLERTRTRPSASALAAAEVPLTLAARRAALRGLGPFREAVARRSRRDVLRVDTYFAELDADLASRGKRAKGGRGFAAKRELLPGERERRLTTLRGNATLRVTLEPVALLAVQAPAACAELRVRRRKRERVLHVRYHPLLHDWLPLACEGCGAATRAFGACDLATHVLCPACLDGGGHRRCPRCMRGDAPLPTPSLTHAAEEEWILVPAFAQDSPLTVAPTPSAPTPSAPTPSAPTPSAPTPSAPTPSDSRRGAATLAEPGARGIGAGGGPGSRARLDLTGPRAGSPGSGDLARRVEDALREAGSPLSSAALQELTGEAATRIRVVLAPLIREERVRRSGRGRGTRYTWCG